MSFGAQFSVRINEVGLRDGLQNQQPVVPTATKLKLLGRLLEAGVAHAEVASFVSPKAVPQMADAADVFAGLTALPAFDASALVANRKGAERAVAAGARAIAVTPACTEAMNRANLRMSLENALSDAESTIRYVKEQGLRSRCYLAVAFACPFEGPTSPDAVARIASRMHAAGADDLIIADTIGAGGPFEVRSLLALVAQEHPLVGTSVHFHDTRGMALANCLAAYDSGIRQFDAAIGGLGGCPFAPGAAGNVSTEDVVNLFESAGISTGISLEALQDAVRVAENALARPLGGRWTIWRRSQQSLAQCGNVGAR